MTNPTVNSSIPQLASLQSLLYISPDCTAGAGAWDAKNSVFWPLTGSSAAGSPFSSVACGTSGKNGLHAPDGLTENIDLNTDWNQTNSGWELTSASWTIMMMVRPTAASAAYFLLNRDIQGYAAGPGGNFTQDGYYVTRDASGYLNFVAVTQPSFGTIYGNAGSCPTNQLVTIFAVSNNGVTTLYTYGTASSSTQGSGGQVLAFSDRSPSQRRPALFASPTGTSAQCDQFIAASWTTALTTTEMQSFGTTEAALLGGSAYATAFNFGSTVTLTGSNLAQANNVTSGAISSGGTGTFLSPPLVDKSNNVLANVTMEYVRIYSVSSGALLYTITSITTDSLGRISFTTTAAGPGTQVLVDYKAMDGRRRMPVYTMT
jgi:hypothetical protein